MILLSWLLVILVLIFLLLGLWLLARRWLPQRHRRRYPERRGEPPTWRTEPSPEHQQVLGLLADMQRDIRAAPFPRRLAAARALVDRGFAGTPSDPGVLGVDVVPVAEAGVRGEWVLAPNADANRRMLYIHGGGMVLGSPASHRALTSALSHRTGVAVFAINYRLMPEYRWMAAIRDCRSAYRWMLEHGPAGAESPVDVCVAGDSAGGSLTLGLIAWIRDAGLRPPDAAVAFSPATDYTFKSQSLRDNAETDVVLGPSFGRIMHLPRVVLAGMTLMTMRMRPRNPALSPLHGELSDLPPTLIQVSTTEMAFDDARRYAHKATEQGSHVALEQWPGVVHAWQIFVHVLPEAGEALDRVAAFLDAHRNRQKAVAGRRRA